jgi:hypothetical protein
MSKTVKLLADRFTGLCLTRQRQVNDCRSQFQQNIDGQNRLDQNNGFALR